MIQSNMGAGSATAALIGTLRHGPSLIIPLVREVAPANLKRRPAPEKWSAHEHACHLATVHTLFFDRLDRMLREESAFIVPYEPGDEAPDMLLKVDLDAALARYARERAEILTLIRPLTAAQWERTARHAEYSHYSIFIMFRHLALHDMLHAYRIEELMLKKDW
jgi:hypothetical protein